MALICRSPIRFTWSGE